MASALAMLPGGAKLGDAGVGSEQDTHVQIPVLPVSHEASVSTPELGVTDIPYSRD